MLECINLEQLAHKRNKNAKDQLKGLKMLENSDCETHLQTQADFATLNRSKNVGKQLKRNTQ